MCHDNINEKLVVKYTMCVKNVLRNALDAEGHDGVGISPVPLKTRNPTPSGGFCWTLEDKDFLKKFFDDVPKTPSHYCRKDTQKLYLDVLINTKTKLYEIYKLRCSVFGMSPFSITLFNNYFKENNYSLFKPHKDQCNTCIGKDTGNVSEEVYNKHYELKCSALDQKECDKRDNDENTLMYCCDTEALLVSPRNNSNAMYYRTKLNIHNLTFYNLKTHNVLNYMWDEGNDQIECDNFISIHVDYITQLIENHPSVNVIIIWSDGCNYQNRCKELSSAILSLPIKHKITIFQKYLEVGHTHMESGSVQSKIYAKLKDVIINVPSDYATLIHSARKIRSKYRVKVWDFSFFKGYKSVSLLKSIKPTKATGPPYVVDIRQIKYTKEGEIFYKLDYKEECWKLIPERICLKKNVEPLRLYKAKLPLAYSKWKHLQELKATIPSCYHRFYDDLPWKE